MPSAIAAEKAVMDNVSRPLIALLLATVAVFALWLVALKPSSSRSGGSQGLGRYQSAISKAHQAVAISSAPSVAHGGAIVTTPASSPGSASTAVKPAPAVQPRAPVKTAAVKAFAAASRLNLVGRALTRGKVIVLLFYNTAAFDDRAVKQELAAVPAHGGRVMKLAVPLSELARYTMITNQVPVASSPTLVIVDRARQAATIVGFADRFEITQRVQDALTVG